MRLFSVMNKQENKTGFAKVKEWVRDHIQLLLVLGGIILIVFSVKTQTILITDAKNQEYTMQFQYSVFGYCISAIPMTESAQPIAADYMFLTDGFDESVGKAASWIHEKTGSDVEVYVNGYPHNSDKLTEHLIEMLQEQGIGAVKMEAEK